VSVLRQVGQSTRRMLPNALVDGLEVNIVQAGHPHGLDLPRVIGIKITAAALATLFNAGAYDSKHVPEMLEFCKKNLQNLSEGPNSFGHWHYTYLYYSQVMYRQGNKEWEPFRDKLYGHIIKEQQADGSWKKLTDPKDKGGDENLYYEDKWAMIWPIDNSIKGFEEQGCAVVCHLGQGKPYGNKYTNNAGEIGDMADFTERLDQIVGGLAVVFDDQQAHLRGSCGHGEHAFSHHGAVALHMQGDRRFSRSSEKSGR